MMLSVNLWHYLFCDWNYFGFLFKFLYKLLLGPLVEFLYKQLLVLAAVMCIDLVMKE